MAPRPALSAGGQFFGFGPRPYGDYFPHQPATIPQVVQSTDEDDTSKYLPVYAGYDPDFLEKAKRQGESQAFMQNMDSSTPEGITGLQRLIGQGLLDPHQATAIASLGRYGTALKREQDMANRSKALEQDQTKFLADLHRINPMSKDFFDQKAALLDKYDPSILANPVMARMLDEYTKHALTRAATAVPKPDPKLRSAYEAYDMGPKRDEKLTWMRNLTGNKTMEEPPGESPLWHQAQFAIDQANYRKLEAVARGLVAEGGVVPPDIQQALAEGAKQYHPQLFGAQEAQAPAAAPQSTEGAPANVTTQEEYDSIPKGSVYYWNGKPFVKK